MASATKKTRPAPVVSAARAAAQKAVDNAKSDQEKKVARQQLKAVKFTEIAPARMARALGALGNVRKLANRAGYSWSDEQATKMITALAVEVKALETALKSNPNEKKAVAFAF